MIIAFFYVYQVYATVVTLVGHLWYTVKGFLIRYNLRGTIDNLSASCQNEVLSRRDKRAILPALRTNRKYTREQIRRLYTPHLSSHTIDRLLRLHNIKKWLAMK